LRTRTLRARMVWIILFALVQLVLQPAGALAWCALKSAAGSDCCCMDPAMQVAGDSGCCAEEEEGEPSVPPTEPSFDFSPPTDCACAPIGDPLPATTPGLVEFLALAPRPRAVLRLSKDQADAGRGFRLERREPGWQRPPLRLLLQVFRL
jgi:hypothetical protein